MSRETFKPWQGKYPNLYREYPMCGFYHPSGWDTLVHCLSAILESHIARMPEEDRPNFVCQQTKEKFGGLRFYMSGRDDFISGAIALAEDMSFHICQDCGAPGKSGNGGWIRVLCPKCEEKGEKR